jgi:hypothetical protein
MAQELSFLKESHERELQKKQALLEQAYETADLATSEALQKTGETGIALVQSLKELRDGVQP